MSEGIAGRREHGIDFLAIEMSAIRGVVWSAGIEDFLLEGSNIAILKMDAQLEAQFRADLGGIFHQGPWGRS
jgi:hypothetical protein